MSDVVYVKTLPCSKPFFECLYCKEKITYAHRLQNIKGLGYSVCDKCYQMLTGDPLVREVFLAQPNIMPDLKS